jgi:hypothetical protein
VFAAVGWQHGGILRECALLFFVQFSYENVSVNMNQTKNNIILTKNNICLESQGLPAVIFGIFRDMTVAARRHDTGEGVLSGLKSGKWWPCNAWVRM